MSKVLDFNGDNGFCTGGVLYQKPKELNLLLSLGRHVDMYFPSRKRSRVSETFIVSEEPKSIPSIEILPDECLFEVFRRLPGGQERGACASVSKRWLMLLSTICKDEICTTPYNFTQTHESNGKLDSQKSTEPKEKGEAINLDDECLESDPHGFLTRCLEGKKASDVRLAAISVGTVGRGGLGKLLIRGNKSTSRLTDFGLKAISRGCPSLKVLSLWNLSSVGDEGLSAIATGCHSLEKLDLCHCPSITDKGLISIARNCPNLTSVTLESCANIGNESLKALGQSCRNLKSITLKNCMLVGDQGIAGLFTSAGNVLTKVNLQSLNISDVSLAVVGHYGSALADLALADLQNVNERGFWVMGKGQGLQKLKYLFVASCLGVSDMVLDAIGHGCPELKTVALLKCPFVSDNGLVTFAKAAGSLESLKLEEIHRVTQFGVFGVLVNCNGKLKALTLVNCLGVKDVPIRFSLTTFCNSLRSLTVRNCPGVGNFGLSVMGQLCPSLTHVTLAGLEGITDSGVYPLFQRSKAGMVKVNLNGCVNLTDSIVSEITEIHGETLEVLNLEGCKNITDVSLMAVAKNCSVLSELDISHCGTTDYGIGILAGAKQLGIQILSLAGCSSVSGKSLPFLVKLGKTLFGLNIQHCSGISSSAVNLLIEKLWRCDILS
ncbi:EIN3-binding F-box protein 1 [Striga hermonthica]|uniref:EIN3-binding F-box protein 1 n=1 Tax=Striga hermonthica TaxID=68872 RepID=A0A9N7NTQ4_STRHE|nr:EIN3-binding F-box protein 1 [Striga hermonthica]